MVLLTQRHVSKHDSKLGNSRAYSLFEYIQAQLKNDVSVPRDFADYPVLVDGQEMAIGAHKTVAPGVELERKA